MRFFRTIRILTFLAVIFMAGGIPYAAFGDCDSKNIVVKSFELRKPGGGQFTTSDNYSLGQEVTGEIWLKLISNSASNGFSLLVNYELHRPNMPIQIVTLCLFPNENILLNDFFKVTAGNVTWKWGEIVEIKNIILAWQPNNNGTCPALNPAPFNQCYTSIPGFRAVLPLVPNFTFSEPACDSRTITFTNNTAGGVGPYTYSWNFNGAGTSTQTSPTTETNPIFTYSQPGTYSVTLTATDNSSPTVTNSITKTVIIPSQISIISTTTPSQINGSTGSINISVSGGTAPYSFLWTYPNGSTTSTSEDIGFLPKGSYSIRVTDAKGCILNSSFTVTELLTPNFSFSQVQCNNRFEFTDLTAGGTPPGSPPSYTYAWDFNSDGIVESIQKNPVFDFSPLYIYPDFPPITSKVTLTVSDGNTSSSVFKDLTIDPNFGIQVTIVPTRSGESTGNISVTQITGGKSPYNFAWMGPGGFSSTEQNIYNLSEGFYTLTITDANGCMQKVEYYLDPASVLNLQWRTVDVKESNQKVAVNWETNFDIEGGQYIIERSFKDINRFHPVGELKSILHAKSPNKYSFSDETYPIFEDLIYYRIVYTLDQEKSYSPIKLVKREPNLNHTGSWTAFPNPSRGETINLKFLKGDLPFGEKVQIQAVNGGGFFKTSEVSLDGGNTLKLSDLLGELPRGVTFLRIQWQSQSETIKLIRTD